MKSKTNIAIIGAGPAGCSAALYLSERGYSCTLIEKDVFPREKTCGDALGGYVISVLNQINPNLLDSFVSSAEKLPIKSAVFYSPKFKKLIFETEISKRINGPESFISKRVDFDNFLADQIKNKENISFIQGLTVSEIIREQNIVKVKDTTGNCIASSSLVIVSNGANSIKNNNLFNHKNIFKYNATGIRAYFNAVNWPSGNESIHIFFLKELLPGYLWIFPSTKGNANVGLATDVRVLKNKKINLEHVFENAIIKYPFIHGLLKDAVRISPWKGHSIPLKTNFNEIYGDNFMICGDAAGLANPLTGEGIGESMYSGIFAAQQAIEAVEANDFSAKRLSMYGKKVYLKLGRLNKLYAFAQSLMRGVCRAESFFILMRNKFILKKALQRIAKLNSAKKR